jgi:hypothetical protein
VPGPPPELVQFLLERRLQLAPTASRTKRRMRPSVHDGKSRASTSDKSAISGPFPSLKPSWGTHGGRKLGLLVRVARARFEPPSVSPMAAARAYCRRRLLANAPTQPTWSCGGGAFWCGPPILRSPIGWRAGRPREFLPTPWPLQAANRGVCGRAASAAPRIRGEGGAQSFPTTWPGRTRCSSSRLRATSGLASLGTAMSVRR